MNIRKNEKNPHQDVVMYFSRISDVGARARSRDLICIPRWYILVGYIPHTTHFHYIYIYIYFAATQST